MEFLTFLPVGLIISGVCLLRLADMNEYEHSGRIFIIQMVLLLFSMMLLDQGSVGSLAASLALGLVAFAMGLGAFLLSRGR